MQNVVKSWFRISDKVRYLIVGGFNTGVSFAIYALCCLILGSEKYQTALILSWVLSSVISFFMQKYYVFHGKGKGKFMLKEYLKCCVVWAISYIINAVFLEIFVKKLCVNVYFAQIISTALVAICTYLLFKRYAFKREITTK